MKRLYPILLWLMLSGCPDNPAVLCDRECTLGEFCDSGTGRCTPRPLEAFEGTAPGRFAKTRAAGDTIFYAAVSPQTLELLGGTLSRGGDEIEILTKLTTARPVDLATNQSRVAVVWLGDDAQFRLASRTVDDPSWTFGIARTTVAYTGTDNFAAAFNGAGELAIAFQASDRALRFIESSDLSMWSMALVDDGGIASNGVECPASVRGTRRPGGVGIEPSIVETPEGWRVAYQDADCGDLRLARQVSGGWSVDVVDTGVLDATPVVQRGRTGRWSSLAVGPTGIVGIAYQDELHGVLKYATSSNLSYVIETVDDGYEIDTNANQRKDWVGAWASLDFDARGAPTIVYMNQSTGDLRLAQRPQEGTRWAQRTIASRDVVGFHANLIELTQGRFIACEHMAPGSMNNSTLVEVWE